VAFIVKTGNGDSSEVLPLVKKLCNLPYDYGARVRISVRKGKNVKHVKRHPG